MTTLHAQPYSLDAMGFYFTDLADYETKFEANRDSFGAPVEEYEIEFIDGEGGELFSGLKIDQSTLDIWFDRVEELDKHERAALAYLTGECLCMDVNGALVTIGDVCLYEGSAKEYAEEFFDEIYPDLPEGLRTYIDIEAFARDLELGGDIYEFRFEGTDYVVTNHNAL
ncbi:antirestriction protein ArdA [Sulfuriferula sp. GW1]|uniref:antirestriction protein ArdA n=1 Tax=Sulfuriferula sp. GW1 TaxID=3345111 RepID=UPI0039AEDF45